VLDQAQQEKEDEAVDNLLAGSKRDLRVMTARVNRLPT
jgi:hypothetical protein